MNQLSMNIGKYLNRTSPFLRFLIVGILNTIIGLGMIFFLLHVAGLGYWLSTFFGNSVGAICSFLLNRSFTFKSNVPFMYGSIRFIAVILICYVASYSLSPNLANLFQRNGIISENDLAVLFGMILYTGSNYIGQKHFVFK